MSAKLTTVSALQIDAYTMRTIRLRYAKCDRSYASNQTGRKKKPLSQLEKYMRALETEERLY